MLNYKVLKIDLNLLSDTELECYLILKKAIERVGVQVGQAQEEEYSDDGVPEFKDD
jgi:hypothetical protein